MATESGTSIPADSARQMLERSVLRLAHGMRKVWTIVVLVTILFEIAGLVRHGLTLGFGGGIVGGTLMTVLKWCVLLVVVRRLLPWACRDLVYKSLIAHGEIVRGELVGDRARASDGFRSMGETSYMLHGAAQALETLLAGVVPTRRHWYQIEGRDEIETAYLFEEESPVLTPGGHAIILVDRRHRLKHWLVRDAAGSSKAER